MKTGEARKLIADVDRLEAETRREIAAGQEARARQAEQDEAAAVAAWRRADGTAGDSSEGGR